ncbi:MAG: SMC-Scp complex subunit ScpB [Thermodesulfobacteriota bacterium]
MSKSLKLIVEALLFASDKPLTAREIHSILPDVKIGDISSALRVLRYEYEALGRSFTLKEVADSYQFRSHPEYGSYILTLYQTSPSRLSRAGLETLAIIAYKQPILRQEIERLRGVDSGGVVKMLLEKGLVRIVGRKNLPGRPLIYGTTKKFLEVFDLKDLESLPKMKEIKALGGDEDEQPAPIQPAPDREAPAGEAGEAAEQQDPIPDAHAPDSPAPDTPAANTQGESSGENSPEPDPAGGNTGSEPQAQ